MREDVKWKKQATKGCWKSDLHAWRRKKGEIGLKEVEVVWKIALNGNASYLQGSVWKIERP